MQQTIKQTKRTLNKRNEKKERNNTKTKIKQKQKKGTTHKRILSKHPKK